MQTMTAAGLEDLYREHHAAMVRLSYAILYDRGVAEDVVHEAFIKVARSWHRVAQPVPYLRRAVVNQSISALRRRRRDEVRPPEHAPIALPPEVDETWAALNDLSAKQRTVLALRFYADLPVTEIAAAMSIPLGTAKSLIHRGLAALKEVLEP